MPAQGGEWEWELDRVVELAGGRELDDQLGLDGVEANDGVELEEADRVDELDADPRRSSSRPSRSRGRRALVPDGPGAAVSERERRVGRAGTRRRGSRSTGERLG